MINKYDNKIDKNILEKMYKILINNMFIIYPNKEKEEIDNPNNHDKWINSIINSKDYYIITNSINNVLVGFLTYSIINNNLWISEVQIKENYQNKGVLKKLLKNLIKQDIISYYKEIYIHINSNNIKSQNVFKKIGFKLKENTIYSIKIEDLKHYTNKDLLIKKSSAINE